MLLSLADLIVWFMHKPVYSSGRRLLSGSHKEVVLAPVTKWWSEGLIIPHDVEIEKKTND